MKTSPLKLLLVVCFTVISIFPFSCFAWNQLGHMVVADIAYQNLTPTARAKVDSMNGYFKQEYPDYDSMTKMAYWADSIRSQKIESYTHWHYIDVGFSTDGTPLQDVIDTDNAVWAVNTIEPVVKNANANPFERARFLAFLIHIVSDLHQPLHTVTYFAANHPNGDRGGNDYVIKYKYAGSSSVNLHKLWDGAVGVFENDQTIENAEVLAKSISALYPQAYFPSSKLNDLNPDNWAKEGLDNAKNYVYDTPENQAPTAEYIETGKQVAEQEVALAGYRLANLLNQLLV